MEAVQVQNPEIKEALKVLSKYGMGGMQVHMHDEDSGLKPLNEDVVQLEQDLRVSFVSRNDSRIKNASPVAWQWRDGEVETIAYCSKNHGRCLT